jgi:glucose/arabinose dehydrogenase
MPRPIRPTFLVPALGALALACADGNGPDPNALDLALVPVDSGFDFSIFVTAPPGDPSRLVIVERDGRILLRKDGVRLDSAFLNLTGRTSSTTGEYGVYSLAFHPGYANNHRVFVYYVDVNGASHLSEFQASPGGDFADPATEQTILTVDQAPTNVLYGGAIAFGPDGYLYIALGDTLTGDGSAALPSSPAQDSASLLGKMLRLDVDQGPGYVVPPDNPFVGRAGWRAEIWSLGLRNPWRWSFDRGTGELYIGDVGEHVMEEINREPAGTGGRNYGWPIVEGSACYRPSSGCVRNGLTAPIATYTHGPACSLTGGYVYRGNSFPQLQGAYFYGDYCGGWVRSFRVNNGLPGEHLEELTAPLLNDNVVSFGEDGVGELYVVMASGRIYRIELQ